MHIDAATGTLRFSSDEFHHVSIGEWETNDGKYVWKFPHKTWVLKTNSTSPCGQVCSETNQNAEQKDQTQMIHTIAVTTRAVANQLGQVTESEKLIVGPEPITTLDVNSAVLAFGIKHADKFDKYDPGLLLVHIRVGI